MSPKTTETTTKSTPARPRGRAKKSTTETPTTKKSTTGRSKGSTSRKQRRSFSPLATRSGRKRRDTPLKAAELGPSRRKTSRAKANPVVPEEETIGDEVEDGSSQVIETKEMGGVGVVPPGGWGKSTPETEKAGEVTPSTPSKEADVSNPFSTPNTKTRGARRSTRNTPAPAIMEESDENGTQSSATPARQQWTEAQITEVYRSYCISESRGLPAMSGTYELWRSRNPTLFPHLNAKQIYSFRKYCEKSKLTPEQMAAIKTSTKAEGTKNPAAATGKKAERERKSGPKPKEVEDTVTEVKTDNMTSAKSESPDTSVANTEKKTKIRKKSDSEPKDGENITPTATEEESVGEKDSMTSVKSDVLETSATNTDKKTRRQRKSTASTDTHKDKTDPESSVEKDTSEKLKMPDTPVTAIEKNARKKKGDSKPEDGEGVTPTTTEEETPDDKPDGEKKDFTMELPKTPETTKEKKMRRKSNSKPEVGESITLSAKEEEDKTDRKAKTPETTKKKKKMRRKSNSKPEVGEGIQLSAKEEEDKTDPKADDVAKDTTAAIPDKEPDPNTDVVSTPAKMEKKTEIDSKREVVDSNAATSTEKDSSSSKEQLGLASTPVVTTERRKRKKTDSKPKVAKDTAPSKDTRPSTDVVSTPAKMEKETQVDSKREVVDGTSTEKDLSPSKEQLGLASTPVVTTERRKRKKKIDSKPKVAKDTAPSIDAGPSTDVASTPAKMEKKTEIDSKREVVDGTTATSTEKDSSSSKEQLGLASTPVVTTERRKKKTDSKPKVANDVTERDTITTYSNETSETDGTTLTESTSTKSDKKSKAKTKSVVVKSEVAKDTKPTASKNDTTTHSGETAGTIESEKKNETEIKPEAGDGTTPSTIKKSPSSSKGPLKKRRKDGADSDMDVAKGTNLTTTTEKEISNKRKRKRRKKRNRKMSEDTEENTKSTAAEKDTNTSSEKEGESKKAITPVVKDAPKSNTSTTNVTTENSSKDISKEQSNSKKRRRKGKKPKINEDSKENTKSTGIKKDTTNPSGEKDVKSNEVRSSLVEVALKSTTPTTKTSPKNPSTTSEAKSNGPSQKRRKRKRNPTVSKDYQEEEINRQPLSEQQSSESPNKGGKRRRKMKTTAPSSPHNTKKVTNMNDKNSKSPPPLLKTVVHRFRHARYIPRAIIRLAATPYNSNAVVAPYLAVSREGGSVELVSVNEKWKCVGLVEGVRGRNVDAMAWVGGRGQDYTDEEGGDKPMKRDAGHFCVEHRMAEEVHLHRTLIGASHDGTIFEVDFSTKRQRRVIGSGGGAVFCLTVLDDASQSPSRGSLFAAGCEDGSVRIFDMVSGDDDRGRRRAIELVCALPSVGSPILSIAWRRTNTNEDIDGSLIGTIIYVGVADGTIRKFECSSSFNGKKHSSPTRTASYSWKATTRITVESHGRTTPTKIWSLLALTDGTLVSGDSTGRIQFWDGSSSTLLQSFEHNNENADVLDLAVSSDESKVMACGVDSKVVYIERQQKVNHYPTGAGVAAEKDLIRKWVMTVQRRLHTNDVNSLAVVFMTDPKGAAGYGTTQQEVKTELLCSGGIDTRVFSYSTENIAEERPKLVFKYPQTAPLRLAKKARILGIMRCDRVDLFRLANKEKLNGLNQRLGQDENKSFLGSIIIQGAHNLMVMDISADGKYLAVSDASSLYIFSLHVVDNRSTKTGSDEAIVPTRINVSASASIPSSALKFVPDDSQRLICATITGKIKVLKIHIDDKNDDKNNDKTGKTTSPPDTRVAVEHTFDEANNTITTNLKSQSTNITSYNFPITEIAISPDSTYVATGRNTMSTGSVHIFTISPNYQHNYVVPCTEAPYSCLSFLGGNDGVGETASKPCALAVGCSNGSFYVFDVEGKCISDWSTDLGIPASDHLPTELNLQPDGPIRFACNPTTPNKFLMGGQNWFCTIDLDSPIPVHSKFFPANHLSAQARKAEAERRKQIRRHIRKIPDPGNLTICLHFTGIIFMDFLSKDELLVVEQPWLGILNSLPDALERKRYGS